ncbi:DUF1080 domain-containing protein [Ideonella sp. DXS22W]|uniref:DUF1080 domain-containing protein n=1 Tax=Pseudaquabacterium inlustre TaxID=2984192 RepID=A0ABU9CHJ7_9BURK
MPIHRRQLLSTTLGLAAAPLLGGSLAGCATTAGGWTTLLDGPSLKNLDDWSPLGQGNWKIVDGTLEGRNGKLGYLLTREAYADFELRCEFWADADCNSGLFLRCQDRAKVDADNSYEVNIFDKRPDPSYGTGAIVNVAKAPVPMPKAADRWNTYEVTARGDRMVVVLNGQQTVDVRDAKFRSGPIALQSAGGVIRFRSLKIRTL